MMPSFTVPPDPQEARQELHALLRLLLIDHLERLMKEISMQDQIEQDPEALARYRSLNARWRELKTSAAMPTAP